MLLEQLQIEILERHRLDVRRTFGSYRVALEGDVRGREDRRLCVVEAKTFDVRQIADAARDGDVDVILDAPRLCTIAHAQIGVTFIGAEWHEDNLGAALDGDASEFRKLDVVANLNCNLALVRVEHLQVIASLDAPPVP